MNSRPLLPAVVFAAAMAGFGLAAHRPELATARYAAMAVATAALLVGLRTTPALSWWRPFRRRLPWLAGCVVIGAVLAARLRWSCHQSVLPDGLTWFAAVAAGIGVGEEIAYRGFVQSAFRRWGIVVAYGDLESAPWWV